MDRYKLTVAVLLLSVLVVSTAPGQWRVRQRLAFAGPDTDHCHVIRRKRPKNPTQKAALAQTRNEKRGGKL